LKRLLIITKKGLCSLDELAFSEVCEIIAILLIQLREKESLLIIESRQTVPLELRRDAEVEELLHARFVQ
jgi:hypothetical protein